VLVCAHVPRFGLALGRELGMVLLRGKLFGGLGACQWLDFAE